MLETAAGPRGYGPVVIGLAKELELLPGRRFVERLAFVCGNIFLFVLVLGAQIVEFLFFARRLVILPHPVVILSPAIACDGVQRAGGMVEGGMEPIQDGLAQAAMGAFHALDGRADDPVDQIIEIECDNERADLIGGDGILGQDQSVISERVGQMFVGQVTVSYRNGLVQTALPMFGAQNAGVGQGYCGTGQS